MLINEDGASVAILLTKEFNGGYVAIGYGRDAADVATYNQFGPALQLTSQYISVEKIDQLKGIPDAAL